MAPIYKLTYFPIKGLAEFLRLLMKAGNIEFEDERISQEDWPKLKETTPFGVLPVLTVNGKQYHQHLAIARFIGKQANLSGADDIENLEIDIIADTLNDLRKKFVEYYLEKNEAAKEKLQATLFNDTLPYYMKRLEKNAKENNGHLGVKRLNWVDVYFAGVSDILFFAGENVFDEYPTLLAVRNNVLEIPAVKEWINVRPKTDY